MAEIQAGIIPGGQDIRLEAARVRKRYLTRLRQRTSPYLRYCRTQDFLFRLNNLAQASTNNLGLLYKRILHHQ